MDRHAGEVTFDEFVVTRLPALLQFAGALTGDRATAEDVVQDSLVQFGYLPNEWHLDSFNRLGTGGSGVLNIGPDGPYQIDLTFAGGGVNPPQVTITPTNGNWNDGWDLLFRPTGTINGHPVFWQGDGPVSGRSFARVDFGTCHVQVMSADHDVTTRIVSGLTVANCLDTATWWDVGKINASDDLPPRPEMPISLPTR